MRRDAGWRLLLAFLVPVTGRAMAQSPPTSQAAVVRAVLFFAPTCPHCHKVMTLDLPPIQRRFGNSLRIATVDVSTMGGSSLYQATVARFSIPDYRTGVPTLVVGNVVLVGDEEIPVQLPGIVERGLAIGGIAWPDVPALRQALARFDAPAAATESTTPTPTVASPTTRDAAVPAQTTQAAPTLATPSAPQSPQRATVPAAQTPAASPESATQPASVAQVIGLTDPRMPTMQERFLIDPVGNGAAVAVLALMLIALGVVAVEMAGGAVRLPDMPQWVVPALSIVGLGIASYLSFVEVSGTRAICGPVGDCNTVQNSSYAKLFGLLHVGVLGVVAYAALFGAWLISRSAHPGLARVAVLAGWTMALGGTVFSVYLTFLEPFVIGATCAWCLASALTITLLLVVLTPQALRARRRPSH